MLRHSSRGLTSLGVLARPIARPATTGVIVIDSTTSRLDGFPTPGLSE